MGRVGIDCVTAAEALGAIEKLVLAGRGGSVFTPNVDHIVIAESDDALAHAYADVSLSLADGAPLVWVSRLLGRPLPERVAGSDLFLPLMKLAARRAWRVYLLGGAPDVAAAAADHLITRVGVNVVGWSSPMIGRDGSDASGESVERVRAAKPDLLIVAFGNPKQELWIRQAGDAIGPVVSLGLGAVLDFLVGRQTRAPRWVARVGAEWLFRLVQEPRRLWRRYLIQDPLFLKIVLETFLRDRSSQLLGSGATSSRPKPSSH